MQRRAVLRSTGAGLAALSSVAGLAGCTALGRSDGDRSDDGDPTMPDDATSLELGYPELRAGYYAIEANPASDDAAAIDFETLSTAAQVEVANAVARGRYLTPSSPAVLAEDGNQRPIAYRGQRFDLSVAVADRFREPEHGPESGDDWADPLAIEVAVDEGELAVALRNVSDEGLPVHHVGRPYFGVLVAVNDAVVALEHEGYETNPSVREVDGLLRTATVAPADRTTETLSPEEALTERYGLPADRPDGARIWIATRVGGESVDRLGNRRVTVAGTYELE